MDGILNIYKEKGFTSHDVVAVIRKTIGQKKVGHTGTLDPEAEGVLPICVGRATKLADYIMAEKKTYYAELTLGVTTTTQDHTGEILETREVLFGKKEIEEAVLSFRGEYEQIPPMYSAIKVQGKKLYELARQGQEIERKARKIQIFDIQIAKWNPPNKIEITVVCSKGTYIRTLCADIGEKLGCGAHMSSLLRTATGFFYLENSIRLSELKQLVEKGNIEQVLIPMEEALKEYKKIVVTQRGTKLLHNGCKIWSSFFQFPVAATQGEMVLVYDAMGIFVGIYLVCNDENQNKIYIKPVKILLEQKQSQ